MEVLNVRRLTPGVKALLVLTCAIMTGFMWRVRGSHGWGSMWGMFAVGVTLVLFVFAFFGNRKKMSLEAIPVAVILLGITNGGWGTLNSQMGGYLDSAVPFSGQEAETVVEISAYSGMAVMLLLGFGWMPLFAMFIGSLFSKKEYKIGHYIALIASFYVVVYLFEFVVAHYILPFIAPEAVEMFKQGLADSGHDMSPMMAFIRNSGNEAWFKKIPFGRNYFASIRVISYTTGALFLSLATLIFKKDKVTAFISFAINLVSAVSITVADIAMVFGSDRGFFAEYTAPEFIGDGNWSLWEYSTGFLLGLGIMLVLACLPKSVAGGEGDFNYTLPMKNKKAYAAYSAVLTLFFTFVLTLARPAGMRISELAVYKNPNLDEDLITYISIAVICVVGLIPCLIVAKKNIVKKELPNLFDVRTEDFCLKALPPYIAVTALLYFIFSDSGIFYSIPFGEIKSFASLFEMIRSGEILIVTLMLISFVAFCALYFAVSKKAIRKK